MTKNEHLSNLESQNTFTLTTKGKSNRWKYTKPPLIKQCFICDKELMVKYILPRKAYSKKNLWGYWTKKLTDQHKYICNTCIVKILYTRRFNDWSPSELANDFHVYLCRGSFDEKHIAA